ncbi:EamA family transporter [Amycolatopsis nalaikhensis]|uniref:EamA family transporter n=1 Tax=Amycolatopsis nalaikhensis TaxID=715472 RepID=A0ABY8XJF1_9PSEU|nr:EamA family transporter [Amycolatopsis sp. 2-2]WIV55727.1 EamA family transporter [Amycolatopsis sp. 2-2]
MRIPAPALVVASVLSLETGQAFGKSLFAEVSPAGVVTSRLGLAAAILLAVTRPRLPRGPRETVLVLGFGTAIAGMNLVYPALRFLPVGTASTIQQLGPLALAVAGRRGIGFALLAGLGLWLVNDPASAGLPGPGVALAATSAASMAAYLLLSKRSADGGTGLGALALALGWATALWAPAGIAQNGGEFLRPPVLLAGLAVAILTAVFPYSLEFTALRRVRARTVSALVGLEPAVAAVAGMVVLGEILTPRAWLGVACVVTAAIALSRPRQPRVSSRFHRLLRRSRLTAARRGGSDGDGRTDRPVASPRRHPAAPVGGRRGRGRSRRRGGHLVGLRIPDPRRDPGDRRGERADRRGDQRRPRHFPARRDQRQ